MTKREHGLEPAILVREDVYKRQVMRRDKAYATGGVEIVDEIYEYLKSDKVHFDKYDHKNRFAE